MILGVDKKKANVKDEGESALSRVVEKDSGTNI